MSSEPTMGPGTITRGDRCIDYDRNTWPATYSHHPHTGEYRIVTPVGNAIHIPARNVIVHADRTISTRHDLILNSDRLDADGIPINPWAGYIRGGVWVQTWGL